MTQNDQSQQQRLGPMWSCDPGRANPRLSQLELMESLIFPALQRPELPGAPEIEANKQRGPLRGPKQPGAPSSLQPQLLAHRRQAASMGGREAGKTGGETEVSLLFVLVQPFWGNCLLPVPFLTPSLFYLYTYCSHRSCPVVPFSFSLSELPAPGGQASSFCSLLCPQHPELLSATW